MSGRAPILYRRLCAYSDARFVSNERLAYASMVGGSPARGMTSVPPRVTPGNGSAGVPPSSRQRPGPSSPAPSGRACHRRHRHRHRHRRRRRSRSGLRPRGRRQRRPLHGALHVARRGSASTYWCSIDPPSLVRGLPRHLVDRPNWSPAMPSSPETQTLVPAFMRPYLDELLSGFARILLNLRESPESNAMTPFPVAKMDPMSREHP